jgi:hypothetical protein
MVATKKFSQFLVGNYNKVGDITVGLRAGVNEQFNFPGIGIQDASGNFLYQYASGGAASVNYLLINSSVASAPPILTVGGTDTNISLSLEPKGTGNLIFDGLNWPTSDGTSGQVLGTNGLQQLSFMNSGSFPVSPGPNNTILISNGSAWMHSTATYLNTLVANEILFAPSTNTLGQITLANSAVLVSNSSGVPAWSGTMTNGQVIIGSTSGTPSAATITAGAGIAISNGSNSITISTSGAGFSWNDITGTSATMVSENGYVADNSGLVTLTLPSTAAFGDTIAVQGKGSGGWKIAQPSGVTIHFGNSDTTTGASGSLASTNRYDSLFLVCITANTDWAVLSGVQGIITVV